MNCLHCGKELISDSWDEHEVQFIFDRQCSSCRQEIIEANHDRPEWVPIHFYKPRKCLYCNEKEPLKGMRWCAPCAIWITEGREDENKQKLLERFRSYL